MTCIILPAVLLISKCVWVIFYLIFKRFIPIYISIFYWRRLPVVLCVPQFEKPWSVTFCKVNLKNIPNIWHCYFGKSHRLDAVIIGLINSYTVQSYEKVMINGV